jgi:Protein of unknown function (DUF2523)
MTWVSMLMGLAGPMVLRVLTVLGLGTVTFTGVVTSLQSLIDLAVTNYGGMSADILALAGLAGIPQALGIVAGALTARVGMWVAVSATKFVLSGS